MEDNTFYCPDCGAAWDANDYACVSCGMTEDDLRDAAIYYDEYEYSDEGYGPSY